MSTEPNIPTSSPHDVAMGKQGTTPIRVIGPSDVQQLRQWFAPVQLLYQISSGIPPHISVSASGITEIVGPGGNAFGPSVSFTGSGVTNVGNVFTFSSTGSHGVTTLTSSFTIPALGATGSMSVADAFAFTQGATFFIPNGTTVDQQGYIGEVVSGGGVSGAATVTVITRSLGTYSAASTIASGSTVTWGEAATIIGAQPTLVQSTSAHDEEPMVLTLSSPATPGNQLYTALTTTSTRTITTLAGWAFLGNAPTSGGIEDVQMSIYRRTAQSGDLSFSWACTGQINSGWLVEISGGSAGLEQFTISDTTAEGETPVTAPIVPFVPNSLVLAFYCIINGFVGSVPTGWTELAQITNDAENGNLAIVQGPPTTTKVIEATVTLSDKGCSAMLILPPLAGTGSGGGSAGITQINAQTGPFISVVGSSFIGVSTTTNQLQVINAGLTTVTGPSATITGGFSLTGPQVLQSGSTFFISVPGGGGGGGGGGGLLNYDSTVLAEASITHYYKLNDASGATSLLDSVGSSNLTVVGTGAALGQGGLINDGETSMGLAAGNTTFVTVPSGVFPAASASFSIEFIFQNLTNTATSIILVCPAALALAGIGIELVGASGLGWTNITTTNNFTTVAFPTAKMHYVFTWNGALSNQYVNAVLVGSTTNAPGFTGGVGRIGQFNASGDNWNGRLGKLAFYNAALTSTQIASHFANTGL